ncbi:MAG TPA: glycosyl hydrolase, partial [Blastocatellia bacterium]|nr:glycosyl hydrolase [Blastocatellia bacterium]
LPNTVPLGQNPPSGVVVFYYLKAKPKSEITIEFLDSAGKSIKKFSNKRKEQGPESAPDEEEDFAARPAQVTEKTGMNKFNWDARYPDAVRFPGLIMWAGQTRGPRAVPGTYQVRLTVDGTTLSQSFEIKADPRIDTTPDDFAKQFDLSIKIRDRVSDMNRAVIEIRGASKQIDEIIKRIGGEAANKPVVDAAKSLEASLKSVEEALYQTKNRASEDPLNFPIRLNNKMAALGGVAGMADAAPTAQDYQVYSELDAAVTEQLAKLGTILTDDLPAFNKLVRDKEIPAVTVRRGPAAQ